MTQSDEYPNIDPNKRYLRISNGHVFTGGQLLRLLEVAPKSILQAIVLLDIQETELPATNPNTTYGI